MIRFLSACNDDVGHSRCIGLVYGTKGLIIDDENLTHRSSAFPHMGVANVYHEGYSLGPVNHLCVSSGTDIIVGVYLQLIKVVFNRFTTGTSYRFPRERSGNMFKNQLVIKSKDRSS